MHFWFNQSKKLDEILQRSGMSDEEFLHRLQLSGEVARKTVKCCRTELGKAYRLSPEKLYPDDSFRHLINLPTPGWDMLELVLSLEETLGAGIDEEQVPNWTSKDMTLGKWIVDFLSRYFEKNQNRNNIEEK
ncbi:hypothetical protein WA1_06575 [Scytonema hofmannii PCC 7110]|uniref:Uncharacterized protein n=1 Tax=Scytonema hofmannii PCC 7110 TaxID=128403 RepID=A0A139WSS7_9CYAN|nr:MULTISPECIES: hypothetical protein [Scytonema]KYC35486.1 hypothetical protein WA1_06575 [Scytonema hofmannii PCC 7110]MUG93970.1 hypothetical protein [Scytonema sp. UIC 10036]